MDLWQRVRQATQDTQLGVNGNTLLLLQDSGRDTIAPERLAALTGLAEEAQAPPQAGAEATAPRSALFRTQLAAAMTRLVESGRSSTALPPLTLDYPPEGAVFPPEIASPTFRWHDPAPLGRVWLVDLDLGGAHLAVLVSGNAPEQPLDPECVTETNTYRPSPEEAAARTWRPERAVWEALRDCARSGEVAVTIYGVEPTRPGQPVSRQQVRLKTSPDPVGAPIFYRDVPLPFRFAVKNLGLIRWRLGDISSEEPPRTVLSDMPVCANCHSFSSQGKVLAMDVDYASDKGSYAIAEVQPQTVLDREKIITWSDYGKEDPTPTFGLLSAISPDGRYVVSTVKDLSVFVPVPELHYSQLFFPIKGILVVYDRQTRTFRALPGADDPAYVQSNPTWSPDGSEIVFARAKAFEIGSPRNSNSAVFQREDLQEFRESGKELQYDRFSMLVDGKTRFRYDLYRIPFNGGQGGTAQPVVGAADNGRSNYFPRFSPDGRWIVFCQSDSFMLLQRDSELHILPAQGGTPRRLQANRDGQMNSWHSFAPGSRWLVFSSKAGGPYTQLWLTHLDEQGQDSPPVLLDRFTPGNRAANIPEFVPFGTEDLRVIREAFSDHYNFFRQGYQYWKLSDYELASRLFRKALELKPKDAESHEYLARTLEQLSRLEESVTHYRTALELTGESERPDLLLLQGGVLQRLGRETEAAGLFGKAHRLRPADPGAASRLAWIWAASPEATLRDGPRAAALAEKLCRTDGRKSAELLDLLAASLAEVGRFEEAVSAAGEALERISTRQAPLAAEIRARRELYRSGKAYRRGLIGNQHPR